MRRFYIVKCQFQVVQYNLKFPRPEVLLTIPLQIILTMEIYIAKAAYDLSVN